MRQILTRRSVLRTASGLVAVGAGSARVLAGGAKFPSSANAIIARVTPPRIPRRDFDVRTFGGTGDGTADDSAAIARAIDACRAAGGGRIVLAKGTWRTGPIRLRSRMALHVPEGCRLCFIPEPDRYLPPVPTRWEGVELTGYHPLIYALDEHDVAVTGAGTIDGGADDTHWWPWKGAGSNRPRVNVVGENQAADRARLFDLAERDVPPEQRIFGKGNRLRPPLFQPYGCTNVMIEGVTIVSAPFWLVHPVLCRNVLVRGITCASHGPNNDGIDPESCTDVLIEDCTIDTGDDCIALKSGRNADGRRLATPCSNVVIRRCRMKDGHAGVAVGSELSGGVRNVFVEDCVMDSPDLTRALIVKTNSYRGGLIENIHLDNIRVGKVARAVIQLSMHYEEGDGGPHVPRIRNITAARITVSETERFIVARGMPGSRIEGLRLGSIDVARERLPSVVIAVDGLRLKDVAVNGQPFDARRVATLPGLDSINCDKWAVCR